MTDEIKAQILDCMKWDRDMIDDIRAHEHLTDRASGLLQAIREHLDRYPELLKTGA